MVMKTMKTKNIMKKKVMDINNYSKLNPLPLSNLSLPKPKLKIIDNHKIYNNSSRFILYISNRENNDFFNPFIGRTFKSATLIGRLHCLALNKRGASASYKIYAINENNILAGTSSFIYNKNGEITCPTIQSKEE